MATSSRRGPRSPSSSSSPSSRASPSSPARAPNARGRRATAPRAGFQRVRAAHANELAQDYAEAIDELRQASGVARVVDLARLLGVSHVTVVRTLARLRRTGLVEPESVVGIRLTPAGQRTAREARTRHEAVTAFLRALGVPAAVAEVDAEGIEHHVSAETLAAFRRFTQRSSARTNERSNRR